MYVQEENSTDRGQYYLQIQTLSGGLGMYPVRIRWGVLCLDFAGFVFLVSFNVFPVRCSSCKPGLSSRGLLRLGHKFYLAQMLHRRCSLRRHVMSVFLSFFVMFSSLFSGSLNHRGLRAMIS